MKILRCISNVLCNRTSVYDFLREGCITTVPIEANTCIVTIVNDSIITNTTWTGEERDENSATPVVPRNAIPRSCHPFDKDKPAERSKFI